jgi:hypothetical protein
VREERAESNFAAKVRCEVFWQEGRDNFLGTICLLMKVNIEKGRREGNRTYSTRENL